MCPTPSLQKQELTFAKSQYSQLQGVNLVDDADDISEAEIKLLISADNYGRFS